MNPVSHITTLPAAPVAHVAAEPKVSTVSASNVHVGREAVVRLQVQTNQEGKQQTQSNNNQKVNKEVLDKAVSAANFEFSGANEGVAFSYNEKLNQLYVRVIDQASGQVIREIPPKEFIEHQAAMREHIGLLLSKLA
ncbi:MAG: flagellar protein FlaG [Ghiorsea sp.]